MLEGMSIVTIWLILLVAFIVVELATAALTSVWFACGALVATVAAACGAPLWAQIVLFLVVSVVVLLVIRPAAIKYFNKDRLSTSVEAMIGRQAIVISEVDNPEGIGQVRIDGMEWTARSTYNDVKLPVGMVVVIRAVDGVKLIVEPDARVQ
jgi:membrane protein implicated in regulation of membrane protease activity